MAVYVESFELANGWCENRRHAINWASPIPLTEYLIRYRNLVSVPLLQSQLHCPNIWVWLQILYYKKIEMALWMVNIFNYVHITLSPTCIIIGYERYYILWTQESGLKLFINKMHNNMQRSWQFFGSSSSLMMERLVRITPASDSQSHFRLPRLLS